MISLFSYQVVGSGSHACIARTHAFLSLSFIIQGFPSTIIDAQQQLPTDLQPRISYMAHKFFTAQPVISNAKVALHLGSYVTGQISTA